MFNRSRHVGAGDYARWVARAGGVADGRTHRDYTRYSVTVPAQAIPLVLWLESDRMGFSSAFVDEDAVRRERMLVTDEARDIHCLRGNADAYARLELYPTWHPYHRDDCTGEVLSVTPADVRAFLATWYQPSNATVVVAGPFEPTATRAIAARLFGTLPSAPVPARPSLPAEWPERSTRIDIGALEASDRVTLYWRAPPLNAADDLALDVASGILVDPEGPLRRKVRAHGGDAVRAREESLRTDSLFWVSVPVASDGSIDAVIADVESAIADLAAGPSADAFDRVRRGWSEVSALRQETSLGRAQQLAMSDAPLGVDLHASIAPADVQRAVAKYLSSRPRVVGVVHHGNTYPLTGVVLRRAELP
jgi:zinc protease